MYVNKWVKIIGPNGFTKILRATIGSTHMTTLFGTFEIATMSWIVDSRFKVIFLKNEKEARSLMKRS